jgi:MarR family transcriptional regulator, organic hydroperoxide resistance regulator
MIKELFNVVKYTDSMKLLSEGDLDYDLWILLTRARNLVFRARELELQRYGLTPEQALILNVVHNSLEKLTPAEMARLIFRKPHTVSAMLDRMEEKGLIKKTMDPNRKNMVRIVLTEKGHKAYEITTKRGPIHRILGSLSQVERDQLNRNLEKIVTLTADELGLNRDNLPPSE